MNGERLMKLLTWLAEHPKVAYPFSWSGFLLSLWIGHRNNYEWWPWIMSLLGHAGIIFMASIVYLPLIFSGGSNQKAQNSSSTPIKEEKA